MAADSAEEQNMQEEESQEGGSVTELVKEVNDSLTKLSDILDNSQGVTAKDQAQMQQIMSLFQDLVENKLGGQPPGEDGQEEEGPMMSQVSAMGGPKGVPMGPQGRM